MNESRRQARPDSSTISGRTASQASSHARARRPGGKSRLSPTYEVVGRGLISRIVACCLAAIPDEIDPDEPAQARDRLDRRFETCGTSRPAECRHRAPSVFEPAVLDRHVLTAHADQPRPAGPPPTRKLALIGAPGTNGCSRAVRHPPRIVRQAPGVRQKERIDRAGAIDRLEDGRVLRIGGQTQAGVDRPARRRVDPQRLAAARPVVPCRRSARPPRPSNPRAVPPLAASRGSAPPGFPSSPERPAR